MGCAGALASSLHCPPLCGPACMRPVVSALRCVVGSPWFAAFTVGGAVLCFVCLPGPSGPLACLVRAAACFLPRCLVVPGFWLGVEVDRERRHKYCYKTLAAPWLQLQLGEQAAPGSCCFGSACLSWQAVFVSAFSGCLWFPLVPLVAFWLVGLCALSCLFAGRNECGCTGWLVRLSALVFLSS